MPGLSKNGQNQRINEPQQPRGERHANENRQERVPGGALRKFLILLQSLLHGIFHRRDDAANGFLIASAPPCRHEIASRFEMSAPAISQHLKTLRDARLVRVRPMAQKRFYELDRAGVMEVSDWIARIRGFWANKLDALEEHLNEDN